MDKIKEVVNTAQQSIKEAATKAQESINEAAKAAAHKGDDVVEQAKPSKIASWISEETSKAAETVKEGAKDIYEKVVGEGSDVKTKGARTVEEGYSYLNSFFTSLKDNVLNRPLLFIVIPLVLAVGIASWAKNRQRFRRDLFGKPVAPLQPPPSMTYVPLWTVVITLMGYASWLVFDQAKSGKWLTLGAFDLTVVGLLLWPIAHFNLGGGIIPPIISAVTTVISLITNVLFFRVNTTAGTLMTAGSAWIAYMTAINWEQFMNEPGTVTKKDEPLIPGPNDEGREKKKVR
jgi:tryptophan-rich sensory protein/vacuolar-type H+-ATPase subunit H